MKTIHKHALSLCSVQTFQLTGPIVHIGIKEHGDGTGGLFVWAESGVHPPRKRTFEVFGTGYEIPSTMQHVGSVIDQQRGFVWHVYEPKS